MLNDAIVQTIYNTMNNDIAPNFAETLADFTASHLAILQEFQAKALAVLRKDEPKMSELHAALKIMIRIEKQLYTLAHRRPPGQRTKRSSIIPFAPSPEHNEHPISAQKPAAQSPTPQTVPTQTDASTPFTAPINSPVFILPSLPEHSPVVLPFQETLSSVL